ncbi:unnamed protein product [Ectocarpus sp. CCAP 1310/34]|nr:unnamed protein product [Ectocarpus sp. CCAP 1310/34]
MAITITRRTLRGAEKQIFDFMADTCIPEQWAAWLSAAVVNAADTGKAGLVQKLATSGAEIGVAMHAAALRGDQEVANSLLQNGALIHDTFDGFTLLHEVVQKANGGLEGNVKQMWEGTSGMAYDTVWRNGLWKQLSKKGKMWIVLKKMTVYEKRGHAAVMLDGELSKFFDIEQGVPQGCTLSPTLFQVFINDLLEVVEAVRKGVKVGDTETSVSGMLFADDFVGMSDTPEGLQLQIDAAKKFTDKWRLSADVEKSAVMVCNENKEEPVEHRWGSRRLQKWTNESSENHPTMLHAHKTEMARWLLLKGAKIDAAGPKWTTPLHCSIERGHIAVVELLLASAADVTVRQGGHGVTPLDAAVDGGFIDIMKALVEHGESVNLACTLRGAPSLDYAAYKNNVGAFDVLVEAGANIQATRINGETPRHAAAGKLNFEATLALLKHGADMNALGQTRWTPLHSAVHSAGDEGAVEVVDLLLRWNADEADDDTYGRTPRNLVVRMAPETDRMFVNVQRVWKPLQYAPQDRAWRHRGMLVLCRVHPERLVYGRTPAMCKRVRCCG